MTARRVEGGRGKKGVRTNRLWERTDRHLPLPLRRAALQLTRSSRQGEMISIRGDQADAARAGYSIGATSSNS
jgi:hypothetical protein